MVFRVIMRGTKDLAARFMSVAGVAAFARRRHRGQLAILMYHGVEAEPLSPFCWHVLDVATLRRQLEYIRQHFNVLPLEEALERLRTGTLPDRAATLTFDDGTRNLATCAAPVLRSLEMPAAVFLATGPMGSGEALWPDRLWLAFARTTVPEVDLTTLDLDRRPLRSATERGEAYALAVQRLKALPDDERIQRFESIVAMLGQEGSTEPGPFRLLSWEEASALARDADVTLHPHTVTHPILARCSDEKIEREISGSCAELERETGLAPTVFAYPNGSAADFDERTKEVLRSRDVPWALSTVEGFADRDSDPLALPRILIGSDLSFSRFRLLVSGAHPWRRAIQPARFTAARESSTSS